MVKVLKGYESMIDCQMVFGDSMQGCNRIWECRDAG